ncbi:hypothetical protein ACS0TY_024026 [Phlomoides rotata]
MLKARDQFKVAAGDFFRISGETTIFHSCLCFFNSLIQDPRRLYAPGRLYHIVERKPFRWFFMDLSPTFTDEVNLIKVINIPLISLPEAKIAGDGERLTRMADEILASLGSLMASHSPPLDALVVRSEDYHQSECVSAMDKRHKFVSGFMSSSGLALITANKALLWTDGRYFLQAEHQLSNKWKFMRTCRAICLNIDVEMPDPEMPPTEKMFYSLDEPFSSTRLITSKHPPNLDSIEDTGTPDLGDDQDNASSSEDPEPKEVILKEAKKKTTKS